MERIICYCNQVSENTILQAISNGANTVQAIGEITKAGIGKNCIEKNPSSKCCVSEIKELLNDTSSETKSCCCCK